MRIIFDPIGIMGDFHPKRGVKFAAGSGYDDIMLDYRVYMFYLLNCAIKGKKPDQPATLELVCDEADIETCIGMFFERCHAEKISCDVAMAPYHYDPLLSKQKRNRVNIFTEEIDLYAVKNCISNGICKLVVHPIIYDINGEEDIIHNKDFYLRLSKEAEGSDLKILIANECKYMNGRYTRGSFSDAEQTVSFIDELNKEAGCDRFGLCFDIGNANICGFNMLEYIRTAGEHISAVILRDCDGDHNDYLLPYSSITNSRCNTDWSGVIRGLRAIDYDGDLIVDIHDSVTEVTHLLRYDLMSLSFKTAKYIGWQIRMEHQIRNYSSRVLFGAGNMCRNYMKYYGREMRPLYTCDNKESLWGRTICGLKIKNPESLKRLQPDCAIIICNIFYSEIEKQLRDMKIKNPVVCFSDEYLPEIAPNSLAGSMCDNVK